MAHVNCHESAHDHKFVCEAFENMVAVKAWVHSQELDQTFSIALSNPKHVTYQCRLRRSRKSAPEDLAHDPAKRRKVTRKSTYPSCKAKFTIDIGISCQCDPSTIGSECKNFHEMCRVRGCITHSHDAEIRHQRLSQLKKGTMITLLRTGVPKSVILERYCSEGSYQNVDYKLITMQDLANLERLYVDHEVDKQKSDFENICDLMERTDFRAFSFEGRVHPSIPRAVENKVIKTGGHSIIIYSSDLMIYQFQQNPTVLFMDGTHGTNRSKFILITLMVKDARGEGTPILQLIAETESSEVLKPALNVLFKLAPEAVQMVQVLMSDLAGAFVKAWRETFPTSTVRHIKCSWHLENAWKRQLLPQNKEFYQSLRRLRTIPEESEFWIFYYKLRHD